MKDFDNWNNKKKNIEKFRWPYFKEWQIWNLSLWINIWVESIWKWKDFVRPILIIKKFNNKMFYGLPMTTQYKDNKYIYKIEEKSFIILSQLKALSNKRLLNKKWFISKEKLFNIKQKIRDIF